MSQDIWSSPLRTVQPLVPPEPGPISCRGNCNYKAGGKPRASQICIELKCKTCCTEAMLEARANKTSRPPCKSHKADTVYAPLPQLGPASTSANRTSGTVNNDVNLPPAIQPDASTALPNLVPLPSPTPDNLPPTNLTNVTSESSPTTLHNQHTVASNAGPTSILLPQTENRGNRRKPLVQPLGPNWLAKKAEADDVQNRAEDLKSRRIRMEEELKRTVDITIYYKVCLSLSS